MGKKLNTDAIFSELSGESAFFPNFKGNDSPTAKQSKHISTTKPEELVSEPTRTPSTPSTPVRVVRDVPPAPLKKRVMKQRHPFDIYHDQYESLQALSLEERKQGGIGSMSAMVREAIDTYIAEKRNSKK